MALTTCPECHNSVSDQAIACPKCGYPLNPVKTQILIQPSTKLNVLDLAGGVCKLGTYTKRKPLMEQKIISIRVNLHLPAVIIKKPKWYVSHCPALDVYSQGDTEDEAKRNLIEAITAFMISCHERGTLDAVLKECGFVPDYSANLKTATIEDDSDYIDVPLPFIIDAANQQRCHA